MPYRHTAFPIKATNATKLPYDTMHRFFTPEDRAAVKKELFCQSRDKGRL